jgi:sporulation protein YlmC with PRC-barrel domain
MNKLMAATALSLFLAVPAMAQAPAASQGAATKTQDVFYAPVQRGEWRASKLMGARVINAAGERIGDINNLLIDKEHKVSTVIIGVGGYLGVGERYAAVTFNALQLTRDVNDQMQVRVNLTKDQLTTLPEWTWQPGNDRRASRLIGSKVVNMGGDTVGDINELLIDKEGNVVGAIVGVGGFLAMGERHLAINFDSLQLTHDTNDNTLVRVRVTKDQLLAAPEWKWQPAPTN